MTPEQSNKNCPEGEAFYRKIGTIFSTSQCYLKEKKTEQINCKTHSGELIVKVQI